MWFWKQLNLWFLNAKIQPGVDFRRGKWQCLGVIKITVHSMPYLIRHTLCTCNMRENSRRVGRSAAPAVSPDIHPSTTPPTTPVLRVTPTVYLPNSSARKIVFAACAFFSAFFFFFFLCRGFAFRGFLWRCGDMWISSGEWDYAYLAENVSSKERHSTLVGLHIGVWSTGTLNVRQVSFILFSIFQCFSAWHFCLLLCRIEASSAIVLKSCPMNDKDSHTTHKHKEN